MNTTSVPSKEELDNLLKKTFTSNFRSNYITVEGYTLPERYREYEQTIRDFEVFDTDLWITGSPKTGTTWISEIAWLILHDFDYEGAIVEDYFRTRMMELTMLFDPNTEMIFGESNRALESDSFSFAKDQKHPRTIKSHLPFLLLPEQIRSGTKKPKIIYTARNPMDTSISYYHHCKNYEGFTGTLEEFGKLFLYGKANYGPYDKHVLSFWEQRERSNILFLTYEEIKKDSSGVIKKVAKLLGKTITNEDVTKLEQYVSFDSMKKNPAVNKESVMSHIGSSKNIEVTPFIRSGTVGGYKKDLSPELIAQFRYWMGKRFEGTGLNLLNE